MTDQTSDTADAAVRHVANVVTRLTRERDAERAHTRRLRDELETRATEIQNLRAERDRYRTALQSIARFDQTPLGRTAANALREPTAPEPTHP